MALSYAIQTATKTAFSTTSATAVDITNQSITISNHTGGSALLKSTVKCAKSGDKSYGRYYITDNSNVVKADMMNDITQTYVDLCTIARAFALDGTTYKMRMLTQTSGQTRWWYVSTTYGDSLFRSIEVWE